MTFEFDKPRGDGANLHTSRECTTCVGDRFVVVSLRTPQHTPWTAARKREPRTDVPFEEYAACPDCNPTDTSFRRFDGTYAAALDTAKVREYMTVASPPQHPVPPPAGRSRKLSRVLRAVDS